jgi:hypothetical protein
MILISLPPKLFKVFFPPFNDNIGIFVNCIFNLFEVIGFNALLFKKFKLGSIPNEFGHSSIALNMDMQRLMLSAIEKEGKTRKTKYLWHTIIVFDGYYAAKIGIIFDTRNRWCFF